jgi:uncharacterized membrane protein YfcA
MWEHYKSTFLGMQLMILTVTAAVYLFFGHVATMAAIFFLTMQVGSVLGAWWANRLRRRLGEQRDKLPLKACA